MASLLETRRLIIRGWIPDEDAEEVFTMYNDPDVTYFLGSAACPNSIESQRQRLIDSLKRSQFRNNGSGSWAIVEKTSNIIVGKILLSELPDANWILTEDFEIGWHLRRSAWGKGYATEAAYAMLEHGFHSLHLPVIYAVVHPDNYRSIRVTQRLNMIPLGLSLIHI